jgi:hypothetical protein
MGILDEAIREHLELKRQHGADDSELRELEDEAFGPPGRPGDAEPDPAAEAATQFMEQPDLGEEQPDSGEAAEPEAQEPVPAPTSSRREPAAGIADLQEAPEQPRDEGPEDEPVEEDQPAAEHEAIPREPAGHSTEERHAIADQPTEMFDVEGEFASSDSRGPSDEDLVAEEISEPRLAPADPIDSFEKLDGEGEIRVEETGAAAEPSAVEEEEDDFFDEQRLSDELDQALEAPPRPAVEEEDDEDFEDEAEEEPRHEVEEIEDEAASPTARHQDEDLLEETPDFLEEAPEDDQLWFEQKPPKDFDFDD